MMKDNNKLLVQLSKFENLYELEDSQINDLANLILSSVNLKKLRESIDNACKILSGVGEPSFGADAKFIALDNQKRLNLIYQLLDKYKLLELGIKNLKSNKNNCSENFDFIYSIVSNTVDLLKTVESYSDFRINEYEENMKYLASKQNNNLLGNGNN